MKATEPVAGRPWKRAALWLLFLGPFFFGSYGFALWVSSHRAHVGSIVFDWEQLIPFLDWTIFPYWSIDALYAASVFVCATAAELDTHARRLLAAQIISVTGFLAFPLQFSFVRPASEGTAGLMFDILSGFDRPFNQMPSLHIGLLVVLWVLYARHTPPRWRWLLHGWFVLIGVSVLTTWQHHFIDVPTGAWVGLLCVWLFPLAGEGAAPRFALTRDAGRLRLAGYYAVGALAVTAVALGAGGTWLWLLWASGALLLVAAKYSGLGVDGFQKQPGGSHSGVARALLWPYLWGAWLNSRLWTWRDPRPVPIADDVWLGRIPTRGELEQGGFRGIVDLTAECAIDPGGRAYRCVPLLDLVVPAPSELAAASDAIETVRRRGKTLVCCALGYSRSAAAVAAWLVRTRRARDADEAAAIVRRARPRIVLRPKQMDALRAACSPAPA
jgi:protein-tyrosine phosphatase/membrane-associated phospholipid phosphatase